MDVTPTSAPDRERRSSSPGSMRVLGRRSTNLTTAVVFILASTIALLRLPEIVRATVWAEDGVRFLGTRIWDGPFASITVPFDGYLHVVPRLLTDAVVLLVPLDGYAYGVAVASALVAGAVAALVFRLSIDLVPWLPARVALAFLVVLVPTGPIEVLGNLANVHWLLLWTAPWLLLGRTRSWLASWCLGAVALLMALTEIQMALFLPLVFFRRRERRVWPVFGGMLLGVVVQLLVTITSPRTPTEVPGIGALGSLIRGYLIVPGMGSWTGHSTVVGEIVKTTGSWVPLLAVVPLFAAAVYIWVRGSRDQRVLAIALPAASVLLYTAAFVVNAGPAVLYTSFAPEQWDTFAFTRYSFAPSVLLLALLPITASVLRERGAVRRAVVVLLVLAVVCIGSFRVERLTRDAGPEWTSSLRDAADTCRASGENTVTVAVAPVTWAVVLPCRVVLGE